PSHAPHGGRVMLARELYFSGNTVVFDHGLGVFSLLAHLSAIDVHEGDAVSADQVVGRVGATGRVTGAHLHWAVRISDARVDPLSVLALLGPGAGVGEAQSNSPPSHREDQDFSVSPCLCGAFSVSRSPWDDFCHGLLLLLE